MLIVSVVALGSKVVPGLVMATTGVRWIVDGVYQSGGAQAWQHVGGIIGVVLFAAALYTALALALEDQRKRTVLPTLRRGTAADVLKSDLSLQTEQVAAEAGVRSEL
jgi:uncharacterized protein